MELATDLELVKKYGDEFLSLLHAEENKLLSKFGCSCYNQNYCSEICRRFSNADPAWIMREGAKF